MNYAMEPDWLSLGWEDTSLRGGSFPEVMLVNRFLYPGYLSPSDVRIPFKFQRRQFPLSVSFAMTINKSQGQSLKHICWCISTNTCNFSQTVVCCCFKSYISREGLKILIMDEDGEDTNVTSNVVYDEVFRNLR